MGRCGLESGDAAPAAIPIRKMTISITQTLLLIIEWRICHAQEEDRRPPGVKAGQRRGRCHRHRIQDAHGRGQPGLLPLMVEAFHERPRGGDTPSWFRSYAISRGVRPATYSSKIRRTISASASTMTRLPLSPRTGT